jgi:hypothetical protein
LCLLPAEVTLFGNNGTQIPRGSLQFALQPGTWDNMVASNCNDGVLTGSVAVGLWWVLRAA